MQSIKKRLKSTFPVTYHWQWEMRQRVRNRELFKRKWWHYYSDSPDWLKLADDFMYDVVKSLPPHIDTVLDVGCGSGRNFIPFNEKYRLIGIDIVPEKKITWVHDFKRLTYYQATVEQYTKKLEAEPIDMRHTLVLSYGTIMYVSKPNQMRFFGACLANSCRNFIFTEPTPESQKHPTEHFKLPQYHFEVKDLAKKAPEVLAYCLLEKPLELSNR